MSTFDPSSTQQSTAEAPLLSTFADDPDMAELIGFFVDEMADRVTTIRDAEDKQDLNQLRMIAHQLKGSGAGYGFETITQSAGKLEQLIDLNNPDVSVDSLRSQIDDLVSLCSRASV